MQKYRFSCEYPSFRGLCPFESWNHAWENPEWWTDAEFTIVAADSVSAIQQLFKHLLDTVRPNFGEYFELHEDDLIVIFSEEGVPVEAVRVHAIDVNAVA